MRLRDKLAMIYLGTVSILLCIGIVGLNVQRWCLS